MWSKRHEFQLSVKLGLRKGLSLIRGMRRALTDDEQEKIAGAIVEQVELSNWRVEQGEMLEGHASIMRGNPKNR